MASSYIWYADNVQLVLEGKNLRFRVCQFMWCKYSQYTDFKLHIGHPLDCKILNKQLAFMSQYSQLQHTTGAWFLELREKIKDRKGVRISMLNPQMVSQTIIFSAKGQV